LTAVLWEALPGRDLGRALLSRGGCWTAEDPGWGLPAGRLCARQWLRFAGSVPDSGAGAELYKGQHYLTTRNKLRYEICQFRQFLW